MIVVTSHNQIDGCIELPALKVQCSPEEWESRRNSSPLQFGLMEIIWCEGFPIYSITGEEEE